MGNKTNFRHRFYPESTVDNVSFVDGTVTFYAVVRGLIERLGAKQVLDYGAGRGAFWHLEGEPTGSFTRRALQDMRSTGAEITAADIDPVVMEHPCSHHQAVFTPGKRLPFEDAQFDIIVSDWVFEHIADPESVCPELLRVLRPGGYICARTPNRLSYVRFAAELVPNSSHQKALARVQPDRLPEDVFPTVYKLNSVKDLEKAFPGCKVAATNFASEPAYHFGSGLVYRAFQFLHWLLPKALKPTSVFFIQKPV